jgi:DNA repair and recombination protein RAD54B
VPLASVQTIPQFHTALTKPKSNEPRHDPNAPDAIVLPRPGMSQGAKAIDVVLDPNLVRYLRPHQREGVRFLYECVMGIKDFNGRGAILADEMGLGKTLTVIALIWTLLSIPHKTNLSIEQSPIPGERAVIKKVLVVCPVTLINVPPSLTVLILELENRISQMARQ